MFSHNVIILHHLGLKVGGRPIGNQEKILRLYPWSLTTSEPWMWSPLHCCVNYSRRGTLPAGGQKASGGKIQLFLNIILGRKQNKCVRGEETTYFIHFCGPCFIHSSVICSERLKDTFIKGWGQGCHTHFHQGPHQPRHCLQRAECNSGIWDGKELRAQPQMGLCGRGW